MASLKQIEANRQNSSKSTGPKTHEGKSVAKLNAIKHGLTSQTVVIGREDPDEFDELRSDLEQALEPVGRLESDLVETIAICMWRRCRVYQMEANILAYQQAEKEFSLAVNDKIACEKELDQHYAEIELALNSDEDLEDETENEDENESWENIVDNETYKMLQEEEKKCELAVERLDDAKESLSRHTGGFFLGHQKYPDALEKILRYEAAVDRSLARAQDQLRRFQRDRQERAPAQATVIDASDATKETSG